MSGEKAVDKDAYQAIRINEEIKEGGSQPDGENQHKLDLKSAQVREQIYEICKENEFKLEQIQDELDPNSHPEYEEINDITVENMTLQFFYNRIYGPKEYDDGEGRNFWRVFLDEQKNYDIEVRFI